MNALFDSIVNFLVAGGPAMWPLALTAFALWYAIGVRWFVLRRDRRFNARTLITKLDNGEDIASQDPVVIAARESFAPLDSARDDDEAAYLIEEGFNQVEVGVGRYKKLITTLVAIAPLLGLLGTVAGMIEAFSAITNSTSQDTSTGIASGIAKALFATQFGLVVAIPGMIMANLLNRKERKIISDLHQVKSLIATHFFQYRKG